MLRRRCIMNQLRITFCLDFLGLTLISCIPIANHVSLCNSLPIFQQRTRRIHPKNRRTSPRTTLVVSKMLCGSDTISGSTSFTTAIEGHSASSSVLPYRQAPTGPSFSGGTFELHAPFGVCHELAKYSTTKYKR